MAAERRAVTKAGLDGDGFRVRVLDSGLLELEVGTDRYAVESFFSYPGDRIGTNGLDRGRRGEGGWAPQVAQESEGRIRIAVAGAHYRLVRTVTLQGHRLEIEDELTNCSGEDVGVLITHRVTPASGLVDLRVGGGPDPAADPRAERRAAAASAGTEAATAAGAEYVEWAGLPVRHLSAENPTLFLAAPGSGLGVLAEDTVSRLQFNGAVADGAPRFSLCRFALAAGASRTLRWALYPLAAGAGYFDFINQVRRDWGTNFTVQGPWGSFDTVRHRDLLRDPPRLRAYLARKRLRIAALTPWLDYDNYDAAAGRLVDRDHYRQAMGAAARALKAADPAIQCTGCMEGNIVGLPAEAVAQLYDLIPADQRGRGYPRSFNAAQEALLRDLPLRWNDCLYVGPDGRHAYELYYRGALYDPVGDRNEAAAQRVPMLALMVYAAPGNDHLAYWLDQARFLIEEVGLDGIYIDQFSLAFTELQRYSYEGWDGLTVEVDAATGRIARRCVDGAWVGVEARRQLIDYVTGQGKVMVANSLPAAEEVQALPIARFMEAEFSAAEWRDGDMPPLRYYPCKGHLASPVGLGSRPELKGEAGTRMYARFIMRTVIDYLRHGLLFYHYGTEIPERGPASGGYGPINHMFPLTPRSLHEGWIEGEERTVTAVSGTYLWQRPERPVVRLFDAVGRPAARQVEARPDSAGWRVDLGVDDWRETAVIEPEEEGA